MQYPTQLIENAVNEISKLPGIGKKTALRLVLHILKESIQSSNDLTASIEKLRTDTKYCKICHIISDTEECTCMTPNRDTSVICVVEDTPEVMAIRNTAQFNGLFHVLGGLISPIDGVGPDDLNIKSLIKRIEEPGNDILEVILALSPTMEGDTTAFYIAKKLEKYNIPISTIARGIPIGNELEYIDEITLGRSISKRIKFEVGK